MVWTKTLLLQNRENEGNQAKQANEKVINQNGYYWLAID